MTKCGTYAGWQVHQRQGSPVVCEPCLLAKREYSREWRKRTPNRLKDERRRSAARSRALKRLGRLHRDELAKLFAEELGNPA